MKERLVRVESEAELRVGAIYQIVGATCGCEAERFMILGQQDAPGRPCLHCGRCRGWAVTTTNDDAMCGRSSVACGCLFRVEDPLLDLSEENPYLAQRPSLKDIDARIEARFAKESGGYSKSHLKSLRRERLR